MRHYPMRQSGAALWRVLVLALALTLVGVLGVGLQNLAWADEDTEPPAEQVDAAEREELAEAEAVEDAATAEDPAAGAAANDPSYDYSFNQQADTTTGEFVFPSLPSDVDSVTVRAYMDYGGVITRDASATASVENGTATVSLDFTTYGKFSVTITCSGDGQAVHEESTTIGIVADEYNICPVSSSLPMTWFSLSLWGENNIRYADNGDTIPTIVMFERAASWNFDALPEGVYGLPYLTMEQVAYQPSDPMAASNQFQSYVDIMAAYVKDFYEVSPDSTYHLYCVDVFPGIIFKVLYANGIPEAQYTITIMSDGSISYSRFNGVYGTSDPAATHGSYVSAWEDARASCQATGTVPSGYGLADSKGKRSVCAAVDLEDNAEWWLARAALLTSGDNNAFAEAAQASPKCVAKSISTMLTQLQAAGDDAVAEFKALYNISDAYFSEAEEQGKQVMLFLGSRVTIENGSFPAYARFTQTFYGDEYAYYYKGHPATPTDMYPSKVAELEELGITDVDSAVAAELIIFLNPGIFLSGYPTSTYSSLTDSNMAKGMFTITKASGLSNASYAVMDWWISPLSSYPKSSYPVSSLQKLGGGAGDRYIVEFSDELLANANYDFAVWNDTSRTIFYYKVVNRQAVLVSSQSSDGVQVGTLTSALSGSLVMDVAKGSTDARANVQVYTNNESMAQRFRLIPNSDGTYCIQNAKSGLVLDVQKGGMTSGTNVWQYTANGTDAQKWQIVETGDGDGSVYVVSVLNGLYLDVKSGSTASGTNLQVYRGNGTKAQKFYFSQTAPAVENGTHNLVTGLSGTKVADVAHGSLASKANIWLYNANGTVAQEFLVTTDTSTGCARIYNTASGMALDVASGSTASGANVQQYTPNETISQAWNVKSAGNDYVTITSANGGGKALDVSHGSTSNGANIQMYRLNGTVAQKWRLVAA